MHPRVSKYGMCSKKQTRKHERSHYKHYTKLAYHKYHTTSYAPVSNISTKNKNLHNLMKAKKGDNHVIVVSCGETKNLLTGNYKINKKQEKKEACFAVLSSITRPCGRAYLFDPISPLKEQSKKTTAPHTHGVQPPYFSQRL